MLQESCDDVKRRSKRDFLLAVSSCELKREVQKGEGKVPLREVDGYVVYFR